MPTYQYACTACGHRFEAVQAFTEATLTECPECTGRLRKVFSSVGIVFKGSGFYRTDSRSGGKAETDSGSSESGSSEKTESTPSTKKSGDATGASKSSNTTSSGSSGSSGSSSGSSSTKSGSGTAAKAS